MDSLVYEALQEITTSLEKNKDFLTDLDKEIGDGDHGINMSRGFNAVMSKLNPDDNMDISTTLKTVAMTLLSTIEGSSGSLYGNAFLKASAITKDVSTITSSILCEMLTARLTGIKERGKASRGDKTIVDALEPACDAFAFALSTHQTCSQCLSNAILAAGVGVEYTKSIAAKKGRVSYLGEKSIGHQDPGATSILIILEALHQVILRKEIVN